MKTLSKQTTLIKVLESFFDGEPLLPENRELFVNINTKKANDLFEYFEEYLKKHGDFLIPERKESYSRPFVWHEMTSSASSIGGDVFDYSEGITVNRKVENLRNLLLLNHQVAITDQLHYILSVLSENAENYTHSQKYKNYIDFLISNKELVDKNILVVCSDKQAYELSQINEDTNEYVIPDVINHVREIVQNQSSVRRDDLGLQVSRILAYIALTYRIDSDEFVDTQNQLELHQAIWDYWGKKNSLNLGNVMFREDIRINTEKLSNKDFVDIRLNDETFIRWRDNFATALATKDEKEFKNIMDEGYNKLQENATPSLIQGAPKTFLIGILGGALTTLIFPGLLAGILGGAAIGVGTDVLDKAINREKVKKEISSRNAMRNHYHYTALIRSDTE